MTSHYQFLDPGELIEGDLALVLCAAEIDTSGEEPLPTYRFEMRSTVTDERLGFINLRVGFGSNLLLYRGHIGYGVEERHRGHRYAVRACRLLLPLSWSSGIDPIWITCNPENTASRKTLEIIGAEYVETLVVPENTEAFRAGARVKCRYRLVTSTRGGA